MGMAARTGNVYVQYHSDLYDGGTGREVESWGELPIAKNWRKYYEYVDLMCVLTA